MEEGSVIEDDSKIKDVSWRLLVMFGEDAVFEEKGNVFDVRVVLKDSIAEGGQEVHLRLAKNPVTIYNPNLDESFFAYKADFMSVNKQELLKGKKVYFTHKSGSINGFDSMDSDHPLYSILLQESGSFVDKKNDTVFLSRMQNGDDLVCMFHERGHLSSSISADRKRFREIQDDFYRYGEISPDAKEVYLDAIKEEMSANNNAIKQLSREGQGKKIFPKDHDLMRVKKSLTVRVLSYVNTANGVFSKLVGQDTLNKLLKL